MRIYVTILLSLAVVFSLSASATKKDKKSPTLKTTSPTGPPWENIDNTVSTPNENIKTATAW